MAVQNIKSVALLGLLGALLVGCGSSPAEKQMEAQAEKIEAEAELIVEQRKTYKEYKKCVMNSDGDEAKLRICEALLKLVNTSDSESAQ